MLHHSFSRSRKWITELVCDRPAVLTQAILAVSSEVRSQVIDWRSPRPPKYAECRNGRALALLGLHDLRPALARFWPSRGPVWDALGVDTTSGERFFVEAKAHIPELVSPPTAARGEPLRRIRGRLSDLKRSLGSRTAADWTGPFYQYSNRLAYLDWLRGQGVAAYLISIYFTDAPDVPEPASRPQWEGALRVLRAYLGISKHPLKAYAVDLFLDASTGRVAA
jgi:hypothetical protein